MKRLSLYERAKRRAKAQGYDQYADDPGEAKAYAARVNGWMEGYGAAMRYAYRRRRKR